MNNTTKVITRIPANCAETRLEKHVLRWLNDSAGYENGATGRLRDLMHGGGISGIISHLIYSRDCRTFLKRHREEINKMLGETLVDYGYTNPSELIKDWDATDPLGEDTNADRLAWFGFETAAEKVAQRAGIEL